MRNTPSSKPTVLIVEDVTSLVQVYADYLRDEPVEVRAVDCLASARNFIRSQIPGVILLDVNLPDGNGLELLREIRSRALDTVVVIITANGSLTAAIEAMRDGADDFLVKPFAPERLATTINNALERRRLSRAVETLAPEIGEQGFEGFIGTSPSMQAAYAIIDRAARSNAPVFIRGESGTGKELCAEAIHRRSARGGQSFVALNCGAIPADLMESEIFGHVKGAFTGAIHDRDGAALRAHGGTLFLDEICEMDVALQVKLLRFIQSGSVQKVGSDSITKVDVRILCATNRNPLAEIEAGRFREDLYYRLHVVPIELPPLRARGNDLLLIAQRLLASFSREEAKGFTGFAPEVQILFRSYSWPGNVRQLQNVIRNIVVLRDGETVTLDMVPQEVRAVSMGTDAARALPRSSGDDIRAAIKPLAVIEREAIEAAVNGCGGNLTEAARQLGINVSTVYRKLRSWQVAA